MDQVIFMNGESGKRIWEAGIVMARFLYKELVNCPEHSKYFDQEELWKVNCILEVGSGTGIGVLPLIKFHN